MSDLDRQRPAVAPSRQGFHLDKRNGKVFGVCAGSADYFGIDAMLVRIGFVAGARRDVFGYSLSALYAGSALAYSGGSLPIEGAPTVARFWHQVLPFTHYLTAQMDQFLGAPARQASGAALLLTGYAAAGLALATWLGGRKSPA